VKFDRRQLLGAAAAAALPSALRAQEAHPFRGLYPIAWTPCSPDNRIDLAALAAQVDFCRRGGVAGLVWPQNASAWSTLTDQEWSDGAKALLAAARGGKTKLVIGVQSVGGDTQKSVARAREAAAGGADGIISLAPEHATSQAVIDYYKAIGAATPLPLMAQAVGDFSVDLIVELFHQVPSLRAVKDEAGNPLARAPQLLAATGGRLADFSGGGGRTMLTEMGLGFSGSCPYVGLADLYQQSFDLWQAGRKRESFDMFGRISAYNSIPGSNEYTLVARGVFAETLVMRKAPGARDAAPLDAGQKQFIREALALLKPWLRA